MGYLAEQGNFDAKTLKTALAYGTLTASFTVEDFSLDRLEMISREDLERRMEEYSQDADFLASMWGLSRFSCQRKWDCPLQARMSSRFPICRVFGRLATCPTFLRVPNCLVF